MTTVRLLQQSAAPVNIERTLRYMGVRGNAPDEARKLAQWACAALEKVCRCRACVLRANVHRQGDELSVGELFRTNSRALARNLQGCGEVYIFCATIGAQVDRLLAAQRLYPARAVACDAAGSAAIELWCDALCRLLADEAPGKFLRPRFSPGYGDLPLELQSTILQCLQSDIHLGVSLTSTMLMTPLKSVTAIVGLTDKPLSCAGSCENCERRECPYRA